MSPPLLPHSTWTAPGQCNGVVQAIHGAASHIRLAEVTLSAFWFVRTSVSIHQNTSSGSINLHHYQSTQCCILNPDLSLPILMHQQCANVSTYIFTNQQKMSANISAISIQPDTSTVADAVRFSLTAESQFSQNQQSIEGSGNFHKNHNTSTFHIEINISHWRQHSTGRTVHQQSTMGNMHQQPIESITILFTQAEHQQIQDFPR